MAIDPYHKSRRIRNVIQKSDELTMLFEDTIKEQGFFPRPEVSRKFYEKISRHLWETRDCNRWQY